MFSMRCGNVARRSCYSSVTIKLDGPGLAGGMCLPFPCIHRKKGCNNPVGGFFFFLVLDERFARAGKKKAFTAAG
jgi:hypothetical protein